MTDFKSFILDARKRSGLSQVKYARLLGVTDKSFANWERGDTTPAEERQTEVVAKIEELERGLLSADADATVAASGDIEFSEEPAETPGDLAVSIPATSDEEPKMNKPAPTEPGNISKIAVEMQIGGLKAAANVAALAILAAKAASDVLNKPPAPVPVQPAAFPKTWPESWGIRRA